MTETSREFRAPQSITPDDLADNLARLVWESFTDFLEGAEADTALNDLGLVDENGEADQNAVEEALIFIMWAHTRGAQQAFVGRAPDELVKESLDGLHKAVFEDMVENGTPQSQIPFFEQRVSARYSEYHTASNQSDTNLAEAVARHLAQVTCPKDSLKSAVTERARAVAGPLKDYFEDVELVN